MSGLFYQTSFTCRTFFPFFNKVMLYMNMHTTVIVATWVEHPNVCKTESISMCPSLFGTELMKNKNNQEGCQNKSANSIPHCEWSIENHL